jgi:hypothetical protein
LNRRIRVVARRVGEAIVPVVEPPGPLHRSGAEHQRAAGMPIEHQ